jgi:histidinol-phosphate aminotransferase
MQESNRRDWIKSVALGGGAALLGGVKNMYAFYGSSSPISDTLIRLNANENPYGPSIKVREALFDHLQMACRYPSAYLSELVTQIAIKESIDPDCVVITGGSTEGLKAAGLVYGVPNREIIAADPTFQALLTYAENFGAKVHRVPLTSSFQHDLDAMYARVSNNTGLIFICNPNNPTGTLLNSDTLIDFIQSTAQKSVVFSDEAYYDYIEDLTYPSMIKLVKQGKNVIVSKTFSKVYGLAGMRIGYLLARPDIASRLKKAIMANTNSLAIVAAKNALADQDFYQLSIKRNTEAKNYLYETFNDLEIPFITSHTNFVFFKSGLSVQELNQQMQAKGILIGRPFPPLTDWSRVSTGLMEDMISFGKAIRSII